MVRFSGKLLEAIINISALLKKKMLIFNFPGLCIYEVEKQKKWNL